MRFNKYDVCWVKQADCSAWYSAKKQARRDSTIKVVNCFLTCSQPQREITTLVNDSPPTHTLPVDRQRINVVIILMPKKQAPSVFV